MNEEVYKILIIEDNAEDRVTFHHYLNKNKECRYEIIEAELGSLGIEICRLEKPNCILLDYNLPDSNGLSVIQAINPDPLNPEFAVVLLTGSGNEVIAVNALKKGAQDYLVKGKIDAEDLHLSIQKAVETVRLRKEKSQALEELRQSEARLKLGIKVADFAVIEVNYLDNTMHLSKQGAVIFGVGNEEVTVARENVHRFFHPDDKDELEKLIEKSLDPNGSGWFEHEHRIVFENGETRWLNVRKQIFFDRKGNPPRATHGILAVQDITSRKKAEGKLRRSHETFFNLVQNVPFGIYIVDSEFKLIQISKGARKVFSNIDKPIGKDFAEILRTIWEEPFASEAIARFRHTIETGDPYRSANTTEQRGDIEEAGSYDWKIERVTLPDGNFGVVCYFYDLTERLKYEEILRESEARLNAILQNTNSVIYLMDEENRYIHVNRHWEEMFNLTADKVCGKSVYDFFPIEFADRYVANNRRVLESGKTIEIEETALQADGEHIYLSVKIPRFNAEGKTTSIVGISTDITERKRKEQNLAFLADISKDFAPLSSAEEILRLAGERIAEYLNLSHCVFTEIDELAGEAVVLYDCHAPDVPNLVGVYRLDKFHTDEECEQLTAGKPTLISDVRDTPRSKKAAAEFESLGIRSLLTASYISGGHWKFALSAQHDKPYQWLAGDTELLSELASQIYVRIERARAEEKLRESEERFRALFDSIDEGFCIIEMIFDEQNKPINYRFLMVNLAMERLTGFTDALGRTVRELVPDLEDFWLETYGKVALTGEAVRFENKSETMNRWFEVYASRVGNSTNRVAVVFNNISDRKLAEREREESFNREQHLRYEAEDASRAKDEFLAMLSHELRSPINAMLGWAVMLNNGDLSEEMQKQAVRVIERNIRLQNSLIEDLLDASRIISGKMRLEPDNISFVSVVQNALDTVHQAANAKGIKLVKKIDPAADEMHGDNFRLQQIIGNLLTNALKFTPENGLINLNLDRAGDFAILTIKDNGIGINAEILPQVFERFQQADGSTKRQYGGLGLGLTIVKHLTEMHGGEVSANSEGEGKGAVFTLKLPLITTITVKTLISENASNKFSLSKNLLENIKLLVVDDDADSREVLQLILEHQGAQVTCLGSAFEALQELEKTKFDILISDLGMAQMDGYDLIRQIRMNDKQAISTIPAIALTGYVSTEDRDRVLEAGFQTHLPKPLNLNNLFAAALKLIEK